MANISATTGSQVEWPALHIVPVLVADNGPVERARRRSDVGLLIRKLEALCFGDELVEARICPLGVTQVALDQSDDRGRSDFEPGKELFDLGGIGVVGKGGDLGGQGKKHIVIVWATLVAYRIRFNTHTTCPVNQNIRVSTNLLSSRSNQAIFALFSPRQARNTTQTTHRATKHPAPPTVCCIQQSAWTAAGTEERRAAPVGRRMVAAAAAAPIAAAIARMQNPATEAVSARASAASASAADTKRASLASAAAASTAAPRAEMTTAPITAAMSTATARPATTTKTSWTAAASPANRSAASPAPRKTPSALRWLATSVAWSGNVGRGFSDEGLCGGCQRGHDGPYQQSDPGQRAPPGTGRRRRPVCYRDLERDWGRRGDERGETVRPKCLGLLCY